MSPHKIINGFTLSLLAAVSLPRYINFSNNTNQTVYKSLAGSMTEGAHFTHANSDKFINENDSYLLNFYFYLK